MKRMLTIVALLALPLLVAACGGDDDNVSQEELQNAKEEAAKEARKDVKSKQELNKLQRQVAKLKQHGGSSSSGSSSAPSGSGIPSDAKSCGAGVYARANTTSCPFALDVAADYASTGRTRFSTYSPTVGKSFTMTCSGVAPVECTGGDNAAVYIS